MWSSLRSSCPYVCVCIYVSLVAFFFFQAEDGIRDLTVTGVQTCALPISHTHLTLEFQKDYYHFIYDRLMRFPAEQAMYAAMYARRTLEAGFTTVRNVGEIGRASCRERV